MHIKLFIKLRFIIPFVVMTLNSFCQNSNMTKPVLIKSLNKDSLQHEFKTLYNLINTIHPGENMFISKKDFDNCYDSLLNSINDDLSILEYFKKTSYLLAKIKDGHTATDKSKISELIQNELTFPFSIYKIKNKYYISKTTTAYKHLIGSELISINGDSLNKIFNTIKNHIHIEGLNETGFNSKLKNFPFYYFLYNQSFSFNIEYSDSKQKSIKKTAIKGVKYSEFSKILKEQTEPLSFKIIKNDIAILKLHSFENGYIEKDRILAEKQISTFFNKIDSSKIPNLIIDLRGNSGGAPEISNFVFSYLINKPYYYFDYIGVKYNTVNNWKYLAQYPNNIEEINMNDTKPINNLNCYLETDSLDYWWFEKQQNKSNYYKGKISVLLNGECFSTTGHFLSLLRNYNIGKFYGEYSQGSNYSNSGLQAFILPYSKTMVWIPFLQFKMKTPNFIYDSKGIKPDVELEINPIDLKTNNDSQINWIINQINKSN